MDTLNVNKKNLLIWGDFPGGPVVKNLPARAGDTGSIPSGKVPHTSLVATTEPTCLEPVLCNNSL